MTTATRLACLCSVVLLSIVLDACAPSPSDEGRDGSSVYDSAGVTIVDNRAPLLTSPWHLSEEPAVLIDGNGPVDRTPLDPVSVFEGPSGDLFVADGNQAGWDAILRYTRAGEFLGFIGGEGEGPGEFRQLWWAGPYRSDSIAAWDQGGDRISVFSAEGEFERRVQIPVLFQEPAPGTYGYTPGLVGPFEDGSMLVYSAGRFAAPNSPGLGWIEHPLLVLSPTGHAWDTVGTFPFMQAAWDGTRQSFSLYAYMNLEAVGGGQVIRGLSESGELRVLDREGGLEMVVRLPVERSPISAGDIDAAVDWLISLSPGPADPTAEANIKATLREAPTPELLPAFSRVLVDPDLNLWVERFRWLDPWTPGPGVAPSVWDVIGPDGRWLTSVEAPAGLLVQSVSEDRVYGFHLDSLDVRHVVAYDLMRN